MGSNDRKPIDFPDDLRKYAELSAESLGMYLLRYLEKLKASTQPESEELHDISRLRELIVLFEQKVKRIKSNTMKSRKLRRDLESQYSVLAKIFNDQFCPSAGPRQKISITSERGRLIAVDCNCIQCSMKLSQGWRFHSNVGDIYFCSLCKEKLFKIGNFKQVNPWSNMVFSAFESNRRKH